MPRAGRRPSRGAGLSLLLLAAFAGPARAAGQEDEAAIRQLLCAQTAAWNRGDAQAWAESFSADADFVNILGMQFAGKEAIAARHDQLFRTIFAGSHLELGVEKVRFLGAEAAVAETLHRLSGFKALPPGIEATEASGQLRTRLQYILVRAGERWVIVSAQNTAIRPEAR